jgi:hypothetical protein
MSKWRLFLYSMVPTTVVALEWFPGPLAKSFGNEISRASSNLSAKRAWRMR